jgi:hypothetical protein
MYGVFIKTVEKRSKDFYITTLLFEDDLILIAYTVDNLQRAIYELRNIINEYNIKMSGSKIVACRR